jgi:hypothetical protein
MQDEGHHRLLLHSRFEVGMDSPISIVRDGLMIAVRLNQGAVSNLMPPSVTFSRS